MRKLTDETSDRNITDEKISMELDKITRDVYPSDFCRKKIHNHIGRTEVETMRIKKRIRKAAVLKAAAIVAACVMVSGGAAYAAGNIVGTSSSSSAGIDYKNYSDVATAEQKAGYQANIPENFQNGYQFAGLTMSDVSDNDEDGNKLNQRKGLDIDYAKAGQDNVMLDISPVSLQQDDASAAANATKTRQVGDITLCYDKTEYMFVPADYKPTDAELNREKTDPHFTISYGSDKVEHQIMANVSFTMNGLSYCMLVMNADTITAEDMLDMGAEIVNMAK